MLGAGGEDRRLPWLYLNWCADLWWTQSFPSCICVWRVGRGDQVRDKENK